jgi:formylglycine-generating enzyme required for sulfatase activity
MVNDSPHHGPFKFPCQDHQAYIEDIPAETDIRVGVYAYDENNTAVLYGFEIIDITAGQVTESGEIEMKPVDSQNPGPNTDSFTIDDLNMTFVRIHAGTFMMGSPEDEPGRDDGETLHQVTLTRDFYMQTTEVTQEQWWIVMGNNPSFNTYNCTPDCPVEDISWEDVQRFIAALEERYSGAYDCSLPTEAQWEYAARAGSETAFANGDITVFNPATCEYDQNLDAMGWYCYNAQSVSHRVAGKLPNAWGLYDMHGNVWEWCRDWYHVGYPAGPVEDPTGPATGSERVTRGGDWNGDIRGCRSATRGWRNPDYYKDDLGFRLVCSQVNG